GSVIARSVAVDSDGQVLVAGQFSGQIDFGGGALTSAGGPYDIFVTKLSSATGRHIWSQRFGGIGSDVANSVVADAAGNALLTGSLITPEGKFAVLLMKLASATGNSLWQTNFVNNTGPNIGASLAIDNDGHIV